MGNNSYDKTFKEDVVDYVKTHEVSVSEAARKFDVPTSTLFGWIKNDKIHKGEAFVGTGCLRKKEAEEKAREKELRDLKEENAILKKALGIFSRT